MKGRFAPSPSGRMHLGNIFTALISWLSVRSAGGSWILRIEDLDPQRSKPEHARMIEDDLHWLGLDWDEGGIEGRGPSGPYCQSLRHEIYVSVLDRIAATGMTYPCFCTRADIMATQAPHGSDGRVVYGGRCRPSSLPRVGGMPETDRRHSVRLGVPDEEIRFNDMVYGPQSVNLADKCGDFILRRSDGAWAYQLAVVADDALMGVTEVVRGNDLLESTAQQIYLYRLLGLRPPQFAHLPLICNSALRRLSKRDQSLSMAELRRSHTPEALIGRIAAMAGIHPHAGTSGEIVPISAAELAGSFSWRLISPAPRIVCHD